jgi:hypothetical protein
MMRKPKQNSHVFDLRRGQNPIIMLPKDHKKTNSMAISSNSHEKLQQTLFRSRNPIVTLKSGEASCNPTSSADGDDDFLIHEEVGKPFVTHNEALIAYAMVKTETMPLDHTLKINHSQIGDQTNQAFSNAKTSVIQHKLDKDEYATKLSIYDHNWLQTQDSKNERTFVSAGSRSLHS